MKRVVALGYGDEKGGERQTSSAAGGQAASSLGSGSASAMSG
jgi:hypothetical protein